MERTDVFHQILETERQAKALYEDATRRQAGLSEYLDTEIAKIREQRFKEAEKTIAAAEARAVKDADHAIAKLDTDLKAQLDAVKARCSQEQEKWADQMFDLVIDG